VQTDVFARGHTAGPALRCPCLVAEVDQETGEVLDHRCSLTNPRFWRPSYDMKASTCRTPKFARCPRFLAAAEPTARGGGLAYARDRESEHTLSWIGVTALACIVGTVIGALAFLVLPGTRTPEEYQSQVADAAVTPAPGPAGMAVLLGRLDNFASHELAVVPIATPRPEATAVPVAPIATTESEVPVQESVTVPASPYAAIADGAPAEASEITHVVEEGETLWDIASDYGVAVADLAARNSLSAEAYVMEGDTLVIPAAEDEGTRSGVGGVIDPPSTPSATPTATPEVLPANGGLAAPGERLHLVEEGETLIGIADKYDVDVINLARRNGLPLNALLMIGDTLVIPVR
jgi:LysM repeat protein